MRGTLAMPVHFALLAAILCAAFALYWATSFILEAHDATTRFGADTWFYTKIADGSALARVGENYHLDRIFRFHPVTVVLGAGWMGLFGWLSGWMTPYHILKAMFSLVGALNIYAAMSAFAAIMPRKHVAFWGIIYAVSLGVWFFSSIEESKIVSAALAAAYIAVYLHLRTQWTRPRAILLTVILLFACLNEIVAGFLVLIPVVDTLMQRGFDLRCRALDRCARTCRAARTRSAGIDFAGANRTRRHSSGRRQSCQHAALVCETEYLRHTGPECIPATLVPLQSRGTRAHGPFFQSGHRLWRRLPAAAARLFL
ncbi:MAG: hypothetical protein KF807_06115 [Xanthobacteraceae bacterium]|nr:hypothetical protein [Xanthobacteraceae bacterium]